MFLQRRSEEGLAARWWRWGGALVVSEEEAVILSRSVIGNR